jgi:hypothetical protein
VPAACDAVDAFAQRSFDEIGERPVVSGGGLPHLGEKIWIQANSDGCF